MRNVIGCFMLLLIHLNLFSQVCTNNEDCLFPQIINNTLGSQTCVNDCNTGALPSGPDFLGNNCYDYLNATAWYQITTNNAAASIDVVLTSAALTNPYFTVFTTTDCINFTIINCTQGAAGNATNTVSILGGTTYLIAVSDLNGLQGNFDLCVTQNVDNSACNTNNSLTVTNTSLGSPLTGPFQPSEVVTFCYNITDWQQINCNYLQGIVPEFGNCWDPISFNAQGRPQTITTPLQTRGIIGASGVINLTCAGTPNGNWNWFPAGAVTYNNISGTLPPNTPLPAGWFFLSSYNPVNGACAPDPTDPDNSFGDGNFPACGTNTLDWQVCFQLQTRGVVACNNGQTDCTVSIKTYADGEIGTWNSVGCTVDLPTVFPTTLSCCAPPVMDDPANQSVCAGRSTTATAFNSTVNLGTTYTWVNNNTAIGLAASGTGNIPSFVAVNNGTTPIVATITVTPFNVCVGDTETFTITVNPLPNANAGVAPVITCTNPSVQLNGSSSTANTSFAWSGTGIVSGGNTATPTVNATGNYTLTVTNIASGCTATSQVTVTSNLAVPAVTISPASDSICLGESTTLTASGGNTYSWSNLQTTISISVSPIINTTYTVTATNSANGCTASSQAQVTINASPTASITPLNAAVCIGSSIQLTAAGGTSFNWDNAATTAAITVSPNTNTTYTVIVSNNNGCADTVSTNVVVNQLPLISINPANAQTCFGRPVLLTASGGNTYLWSNNVVTDTVSVNPTSLTTYTVVGTDNNGCTNTASSTIDVINNLSLTEQHTDVTCFGGNDASIDITTVGGVAPFTFIWNDNITTEDRTALSIGNYSVTATGNDGCAATISIQIIEPNAITLTANITNESCVGKLDGSIDVAATNTTPPLKYLWFDGDTLNPKINLQQGTYAITVSDANNCTATELFTVGIEDAIVLNSNPTNPTCPPAADGTISLLLSGGNGGFVFLWSDSATIQNNTSLLPGNYTVTITDSKGCSISESYTLVYQYQFEINASPNDTTLIEGLTTEISVVANVNNSVSFIWTPSTGLSCNDCAKPIARPLETTTYLITATDENGCTDSDSVFIEVENIGNLFIPNGFSPNGDGANDLLAIYGIKPEYFREFFFTVYDRWGEKVFESKQPNFTWDGTFKGKIIDPTVLVYYIKYVVIGSDKAETENGSLTLLK